MKTFANIISVLGVVSANSHTSIFMLSNFLGGSDNCDSIQAFNCIQDMAMQSTPTESLMSCST